MAYKKGIKGLTLVELLVAAALVAIVAIVLGAIFTTHFKFFTDESSVIGITEENKIVLDEVTNQIRESQSIAATCTPCGTDTTGANVLILQLWPLNAAGEPFDGGTNFDYIVYKRDTTDNTKMLKIVYPHLTSTRQGQNKILSDHIANLSFTFDNPTPSLATEVIIKIKNSITTGSKTQQVELESKAVLRNK